MNNLKIREIGSDEKKSINQLLTNSPFKPYRYLARGSEKSQLDQFWMNRVLLSIESNNTNSFIAEVSHDPVGFITIGDLPWDTNIFHIPMASIIEFVVDDKHPNKNEIGKSLIRTVVNLAKKTGKKFLLCKTFTDDVSSVQVLEKSGFLLVDTLLDYTIDFRKTPLEIIPQQKSPKDVTIRLARSSDEEELVALAKNSFKNHFGRYHSDPNISKEKAIEVYTQWMRSSLRGYADYFVLSEINGRIAGLSVWKKMTDEEKSLPARISHYSIGAIHPDFFGRKLFTVLTYEGMKLLRGQADIIEGPTHINNYPVQRGYTRLNWKIDDARHSFHKWLK